MSLKAVHICFICLSVLLAVGGGWWAVQNYTATGDVTHLYFGIGALAGAVGLAIYLFRFIQKMKKINPLPVWIFAALLFSPRALLACSVCFADPNSALSKGVITGVLVLMGAAGFVLGWIATLIFVWVRKARKMAGLSPLLDSPSPLD